MTLSKPTLKHDISSGFLVFLIALPLSMGIAIASGFPALSGIIAAAVGGLLTGFLGGSSLTIKGPAAGLIVIVLGAVQELQDPSDLLSGFHRALAVGVIAGILQMLMAVFKLGKIASWIPVSVIHGMLAAIGIIIISKQIHFALGVTPISKSPADLLLEIPESILLLNPLIASLGLLSFLFMLFQSQIRKILRINLPGAIVVLVVTVILGKLFDLQHDHPYTLFNHQYRIDPHFLVQIPGSLINAITSPDWSQIFGATSIKYIFILTMVGSIESLLTVSAIDGMDPQHRRSNPNKDLFAVGCANTISCLLGGLPMISEIVRSKANVDAGAKSYYSNCFHGLFILAFILAAPELLRQVPVAALAGILVFVGTRLASVSEFKNVWNIGAEKFVFFCVTCFLTVKVDLLVGVAVGLTLAALFYGITSRSLKAFFSLKVIPEERNDQLTLKITSPALFSTFGLLEPYLLAAKLKYRSVIVDFSQSRVVASTFLEHLDHFKHQMAGVNLTSVGLDSHRALSKHPYATRLKSKIITDIE